MDYVEKTPNKEIKVELIKTLQSVTEGKVGVTYMHACGALPCLYSTCTSLVTRKLFCLRRYMLKLNVQG